MNDVVPGVCIIILSWNGWEDTIECLESVLRVSYPNYGVIVIDNASTDDSANHIKMWAKGDLDVCARSSKGLKKLSNPPVNKPVPLVEFHGEAPKGAPCSDAERPPLTILNTGMNLGYSGGNNLGLRYAVNAGYDYALILNNDLVVDPEFLVGLVNCSRVSLRAGIVGGKIYYYSKPDVLQGVGSRVNLRTAGFQLMGNRIVGGVG